MAPRPQAGTLPAIALYCGLALAATWPLALGLSRDLAWDLGDPSSTSSSSGATTRCSCGCWAATQRRSAPSGTPASSIRSRGRSPGPSISCRRACWRSRCTPSPAETRSSPTTSPFLLPYVELRASGALTRPAAAIERFSADVWSWPTAPPALRLWGALQTFPADEGQLFPGLAVLVLAVVAVTCAARAPICESRPASAPAGTEVWADPALRPPPGRLELGDDAPEVYGRARTLPAEAVIAERPFGSEPWELRAAAASLIHGKRILNGYSGGEPAGYRRLKPVLRAVTSAPGPAFEALLGAGVSHVIVHEHAWGLERKGARVPGSLVERGGRVLYESAGDVLVELPR